MTPQLLSEAKAAKYLGVSKYLLRKWVKQGVIAPRNLPGGVKWYSTTELDAIGRAES